MSLVPSTISTNSQSFLKTPSEKSIYFRKCKLKTDQSKAHRARLLEESKRPKMVLHDKSVDTVFPSSYYVERARNSYLQRSLHSINSSLSSVVHSISAKQSTKKRLAPILNRSKGKALDSMYPNWLLNKPDFVALVVEDENSCSIDKIVQLPVASRSEKQNKLLKHWLYSVKYFKSLPSSLVSEVSKILVYREYHKGQVLMNAGEEPDFVFVVYSGLVGVYIDSHLVATRGPRNTVGEVAFDSSMPRTATCKAEEFTQTFIIDQKNYTYLLESIKHLEKLKYDKLIMCIKFFEQWTVIKIQALSACLIPRTYAKGEVIYEIDSESRLFLILKSGKVKLQASVTIEEQNRWPEGNHKWKVRRVNKQFITDVGSIHPPDFFGAIDLINDQPRQYRAVAVKKCECAVLNKKEFFEFFRTKDVQRLKEMNTIEYLTPEKLHERVLKRLNSKKTKKRAIIEALEVDLNDYCTRQSPSIKQNLRIKKWIKALSEKKSLN